MSFFKQVVEEDNTSLFLIFAVGAKDRLELKFLDNCTKKIWQLKYTLTLRN